MALSSGETGSSPRLESFDKATFTHTASGFQYRVSPERESTFVEFERLRDGLRGRKAMPYFIGSGTAARSYLIAADGFLYESPVAYYSAPRRWDLAPGYSGYSYPYLTRPVLPGCLNCHASFLEALPSTQNRFNAPPFREGGVACERCHGAGESHIAGGRDIINPAKLPAERRDSICSQCHLLGEVRVMRPGANWKSFQPGDRLAQSMTVFVRPGGGTGMKVTSHVENLAQSYCKQKSGDALWCGTCHNVHSTPKEAERSAFFRAKCLGCHTNEDCKETAGARARERNDCIACHMPKNSVADAEHVVFTDHSIPRRPRQKRASTGFGDELIRLGGGPASARDLALAYAIASSRQPSAATRDRALKLLQAVQLDSPNDVEVLLYLAELYRAGNQEQRAIPLYRQAIRLDNSQVTASVGLGAIFFQRKQYGDAIRLWEDALTKNSGLVLVATNLAMAQWRVGRKQEAEATLRRVVDLSPGFQPAVDLLRQFR